MLSRVPTPESAKPRVLLVDDEVHWASRFAADLTKAGLDVRTCCDGPSAISLLREWPADVVLLDERMPGMGGLEVCRRLRSDGYLGAIVIYSAYDTEEDIVLAHQAGADDHVSKAASPAVVHAKIRRAHERVSAQSRSALPYRQTQPSGISELLRAPSLEPRLDWRTLSQLDERLLCALLCARGQVVSVLALSAEGWGREDLPPRALYEPISRLRQKLKPLGWEIRNARGRGYRLGPADTTGSEDLDAPGCTLRRS